MPNNSLTTAIQEAYASAPDDVVILHTLEFRHASFTSPIRVILDNRDWTARLETDAPLNAGEFVNFVAYMFNIELPEVGEMAQPELKITIDNVSQEIQQQLGAAALSSSKTEVTYRPYLSSDVDGNGYLNYPHMNPVLTLDIIAVTADVFSVTATATFGDMSNKTFPVEYYSPERFPGLVR